VKHKQWINEKIHTLMGVNTVEIMIIYLWCVYRSLLNQFFYISISIFSHYILSKTTSNTVVWPSIKLIYPPLHLLSGQNRKLLSFYTFFLNSMS
jgi:hypothetical protein